MSEPPGTLAAAARDSFDAWNDNDWERLAAAYDANVVGDPPEGWPEGETLHGWEALRRQFERLKDSWDNERVEVDDVTEIGADKVLAEFRWTGQGKASGVGASAPMWALFSFDDRRIVRLKYFLQRATALAEAAEQIDAANPEGEPTREPGSNA